MTRRRNTFCSRLPLGAGPRFFLAAASNRSLALDTRGSLLDALLAPGRLDARLPERWESHLDAAEFLSPADRLGTPPPRGMRRLDLRAQDLFHALPHLDLHALAAGGGGGTTTAASGFDFWSASALQGCALRFLFRLHPRVIERADRVQGCADSRNPNASCAIGHPTSTGVSTSTRVLCN